jgi:hypothetical protein
MNDDSRSDDRVGMLGMLGFMFIALKLTGFIDWSWWWVTAPFWGGAGMCFAVIGIAAALAASE